MNKPFSDLKPFPGASSPNDRIKPGGNKPPLDEQLVADFNEALATEGIAKRAAELIAAGERIVEATTAEQAGRYADFVKMCADAVKGIEAEREKLNRPLLNAQRALKGSADTLAAQISLVAAKARRMVEAFHVEERRKEQQRQEDAREAARLAQEAANARAAEAAAAGQPAEVAPIVTVAPAPVEAAPVIQGDLGSKVGTTTVWHHEIDSVRKLPDSILKHEKVVEAINKVLAAQVRGGSRDIKGVRIWSTQETVIR